MIIATPIEKVMAMIIMIRIMTDGTTIQDQDNFIRDEEGMMMIRIGTTILSEKTVIDGRHHRHHHHHNNNLRKIMIDFHIHLLDITVAVVVEKPVLVIRIMAMSYHHHHLSHHHPSILEISYRE